ncbi:hypothetical protein [Tahibacter amnicola]|uniref:Uncharacterized protein n=1 Tax=Tahibacter amnicola TaxID=2976241 RepID=A0ABY6B6Q9_9GAMM|nr:hypothetical protein [Tahibacter amnicola]UXI65796.1 hypothetical protein N4264_13585 [Tahibacter amnicola]
MDFSSAIKPDVYRVLVVILVPGAIVSLPLIYVVWPELMLPTTWSTLALPTSVTLFFACLTAGALLENVGSVIEVAVCDKWLERHHKELHQNWEKYLQQKVNDEIVGQRYLRYSLIRFKFELSIMPALLISCCILSIQSIYSNDDLRCRILVACCAELIVAICIRIAINESALLMARTRKIVIDALADNQPPPNTSEKSVR